MYCTLQGWSISGTGSQQQQWQDHEQPPILELSPEPTRRILELSENYTHKIQCVAGGFGCELLLINRTVHCTGSVLGSLSGASTIYLLCIFEFLPVMACDVLYITGVVYQ